MHAWITQFLGLEKRFHGFVLLFGIFDGTKADSSGHTRKRHLDGPIPKQNTKSVPVLKLNPNRMCVVGVCWFLWGWGSPFGRMDDTIQKMNGVNYALGSTHFVGNGFRDHISDFGGARDECSRE